MSLLTNINRAVVFVVRMKSDPLQEDAMNPKSRSATVRSAATAPDFWEQSAQVPDERDDEIDCQRIVQGDGSRSPPLYYDDYDDHH
jgi:hypothetical protein